MGNDLAKKQLRSLLKHSDQASKLNAKLKEAEISISNSNVGMNNNKDSNGNKVDSTQMP